MLSKKYAAILATGASILAIGISAPAYANAPNPQNTGGGRDYHLYKLSAVNNPNHANYTPTITIEANTVTGGLADATNGGNGIAGAATANIQGGITATASSTGLGANIGAYVQDAYVTAEPGATGFGNLHLHLNVAGSSEVGGLAPAQLNVNANAFAVTDGSHRTAYAYANIRTGVDQYGAPFGTMSADITNNGGITIGAQATASAVEVGSATAHANLNIGIRQSGDANNETLSLTNTGTIVLSAYAKANANHAATFESAIGFASQSAGATAYAHVGVGIEQDAFGFAPSASLTNSGSIGVYASAYGTAYAAHAGNAATASESANADSLSSGAGRASINIGIQQLADGTESSTSISLTNNSKGNITIGAFGQGVGNSNYGSAYAGGYTAHAAVSAGATGLAHVGIGIQQDASEAAGTVGLANSGYIGVYADAVASNNYDATEVGAKQAFASASASDNAVAQSYAGARARGTVSTGISQSLTNGSAFATQEFGSSPPANLTVQLTNYANASIYIDATGYARSFGGTAYGYAYVVGLGNVAHAIATADAYGSGSIVQGIAQSATGRGAPSVTLTNSGAISIRATGTAYGTFMEAYALAASPWNSRAQALAGAVGYGAVITGIDQLASAGNYTQVTHSWTGVESSTSYFTNYYPAVASVSLNNNEGGSISIDATGYAVAFVNRAVAGAGWYQIFGATTNDPLVSHDASAAASAGAFATGYIGTGINQYAQGPVADVSLTNSGLIHIEAQAVAINFAATAYDVAGASNYANAYALAGASAVAAVDNGIYQSAHVLNDSSYNHAAVGITNNATGAIDVTAYAFAINGQAGARAYAAQAQEEGGTQHAVAFAGANAKATVGTSASGAGIYQYASGGSGNNTVELTNSGTIQILALADAVAYSAYAIADANHGVQNFAHQAHATAFAGAQASATVYNGIYQGVENGGDDVSLTNSGAIYIEAAATAYANFAAATGYVGNASSAYANIGAGALAHADVGVGIYQYGDGNSPDVSLTNSNIITIGAFAKATSYQAQAAAHGTGEYIHLSAHAGALAFANVGTGVYQYAYSTLPLVTLDNQAGGVLTIKAKATANAFNDPQAYIFASATNYSNDTYANAFAGALAEARVGYGIYQSAEYWLTTTKLTNEGSIYITADAQAVANGNPQAHVFGPGHAFAGAAAYATIVTGIYQNSDGSSEAFATLTNGTDGIIRVGATAAATANPQAFAQANIGNGIAQYASASEENQTAQVKLTNSGNITVFAQAEAAANSAVAYGYVGDGIYQRATYEQGTANAYLVNSGSILVKALATATGVNWGLAQAEMYAGIQQEANGFYASASLSNDAGTINVEATAYGHAKPIEAQLGGNAYATAVVGSENGAGIYQWAHGQNAQVYLTNSGTLDVGAVATATASFGLARADARVGRGVAQYATASESTATVSFVNSGVFKAHAAATAEGSTAYASAFAAGVDQSNYGHLHGKNVQSVTFDNKATGHFTVTANAKADGANWSVANATANGVSINGDPLNVTVNNAGHFNVTAMATGSQAFATAHGIVIQDVANVTAATTNGHIWTSLDVITGSLTNTGSFVVKAVANGNSESSYAHATGISLKASNIDFTLNNSGTIDVSAQTQNGGSASAVGIVFNGYSATISGANSPVNNLDIVDNINNQGGTIIARKSTDGGATWQHGTAIDVSNAPNSVNINLIGRLPGVNDNPGTPKIGYVYGNILLNNSENGTTGTINVLDGETKFDGVINPNAGSTQGTGILNINQGGTLYLVNQQYNTVVYPSGPAPVTNNYFDGPAGGNVYQFLVNHNGTLAIELNAGPVGGVQDYNTYSHITANNVVLAAGAILQIRPSSYNGLYANSYTYNDVIISTNDITGQFTAAADGSLPILTGSDTMTPLLKYTASYVAADGGDPAHMDINATRIAFGDAVSATGGHLTPNQSSVGGGLEGGYIPGQVQPALVHLGGPTLTTEQTKLYAALFSEDFATYQHSLDQLSGLQYAGYLQSLNGLTGRLNDLISNVTDCPVYKAALDPTCQRVGKTRVWAQFNQGRTVKKDGTFDGLGGYGSDQTYLAMGLDYKLNGPIVLGVSAAYVRNDLTFTGNVGGRIKSDGAQFAGYGVYDAGRYYAKAVVSYSALTAHSTRNVNIPNQQNIFQNGSPNPGGVATQSGDIAGLISGAPKADVLSLFGELGYRFGYNSIGITPYVALEYTDAKLKAFTETGVLAANLAVADSSQNRTSSELGVRIGGSMGKITPELNIGWRHQFGSKYATVNSSFDGLANSDYTVQSALEKPDSAFVNLGLSAVLGKNVVGKIGYQGRFNGDNNSNAGTATLIVSFGGFGK